MAENYADLEDTILEANDEAAINACEDFDEGVRSALQWIDQNPDQVPGRTMTEVRQSDVDWQARDASYEYVRGLHVGLMLAKAKIVPDPEPSNAEVLEATLLDTFGLLEILGNQGVHNLAFNLDKAGVKAPEDDDGD